MWDEGFWYQKRRLQVVRCEGRNDAEENIEQENRNAGDASKSWTVVRCRWMCPCIAWMDWWFISPKRPTPKFAYDSQTMYWWPSWREMKRWKLCECPWKALRRNTGNRLQGQKAENRLSFSHWRNLFACWRKVKESTSHDLLPLETFQRLI